MMISKTPFLNDWRKISQEQSTIKLTGRVPIFMHQRQPTGGLRRNATGARYAGSRPYLGSGLLGSPENRYNLPHLRVHPGNPGLHEGGRGSVARETTNSSSRRRGDPCV